jgi:hypothetical protein
MKRFYGLVLWLFLWVSIGTVIEGNVESKQIAMSSFACIMLVIDALLRVAFYE